MTTLHSGENSGAAVTTFRGPARVGLSVVNALSSEMEIKVRRNKLIYRQCYERGNPVTPLEVCGETDQTGTSISFCPMRKYSRKPHLTVRSLCSLTRAVFLNQGLRIQFTDLVTGPITGVFYSNGLRDFIAYVNRTRKSSMKSRFISKPAKTM